MQSQVIFHYDNISRSCKYNLKKSITFKKRFKKLIIRNLTKCKLCEKGE